MYRLIFFIALAFPCVGTNASKDNKTLLLLPIKAASNTSLCLSKNICFLEKQHYEDLSRRAVLPRSIDIGLGHIDDYHSFKMVAIRIVPCLISDVLKPCTPAVRFVFQSIRNDEPKQVSLHFTYRVNIEALRSWVSWISFNANQSNVENLIFVESLKKDPMLTELLAGDNLSGLTFMDHPKPDIWRFGAVDVSDKAQFTLANIPMLGEKKLQHVMSDSDGLKIERLDKQVVDGRSLDLKKILNVKHSNLSNTDCASCHFSADKDPILMHVGFRLNEEYPRLSKRVLLELQQDSFLIQ